MSVYVDTPVEYAAEVRGYVGRARTRFRWCHMIADSVAELHTMADQLGLRREWFQGDHYDLVPSKRTQAIRRGAIPLKRRDFVTVLRRSRAGEGPE
jgi:hypothetical protein